MFRELGAEIVDSDILARKVVEPGMPAYNDIVERFGKDILLPGGAIDREKLGGVVFHDEKARRDLNAITHPRVFEMMSARIKNAENSGAEVTIVDIPLLYESGASSWLKTVILVYTDEGTQLKRLIGRDNCDEARARARIASQMPIEEKKKLASIVIDNSGDIEDTRRQVLDAWEKIKTL